MYVISNWVIVNLTMSEMAWFCSPWQAYLLAMVCCKLWAWEMAFDTDSSVDMTDKHKNLCVFSDEELSTDVLNMDI